MTSINHHIAIRSDFSIGESALQIPTMVKRAKTLGYETLALADIMTISGMVSFSDECKKAGIKPVIGVTLRVYDDPTYRKPAKASGEKEKKNPFFWMKAFIRNEEGMKEVLRLLSKGNTEEYFYYHARVGFMDVVKHLSPQNVVLTTGDMFCLYSHADYESRIKGFLDADFTLYSEITPINSPLFNRMNDAAIAAADKYKLPICAGYPALYETVDHADTLDVLRAIATNAKVSSPWLPKPYARDMALRQPADLALKMKARYVDKIKEAMIGNSQIASLCNYEFKKMDPCLPEMATDEFAELVRLCKIGWTERFSVETLGHIPTNEELPKYKERLAYELGVLRKMGFSGYFLLVQDIVRWSKSQNIIVGPGRGSVGGSLVAYLMGITDVDPIRFDLLFERFINPERLDLPDADLDFMSRRRGEVVEYIVNKYGADRVAGVSNYNAMGAASAIRDVSRVHELEIFEYSCSKQVEKVHGVALSLEESVSKVPDIEKFSEKHPIIWHHALGVEGAMRGLGQHAAGIVVAGEPLINRAVVETRTGGPVVNWDKKTVESFGLIKMDILGLSTLDMLDLGRKYVAERHKKAIDYLRLPLNDEKVMKAFGEGHTTGVFQFESPGMRKLLKELSLAGNLSFDDLVAVVALYRPGPLDAGLCDDYVAIKQGSKRASLDHPNMESATASTYGVIVYQEQVMQIARDLAGFTMAEADHLRKAMGKKDKDAMKAQRDKWVKGCVDFSSMHPDNANRLFDKIEVFAGYAFNKSHSVEYSIISYWAMWLKVNFPAEFYAASMTIVDDAEKVQLLVSDAQRFGVKVLPPDIMKSSTRIEIADDNLYAPFQAIKGMSEKTAEYILQVRGYITVNGHPLNDRSDFYAACTAAGVGGKINKTHRERMELLGVFAELENDPKSALHPDRIKDRVEFMPGFTVDTVKATRGIDNDKLNLIKIVRLGEDLKACDKCSLQGQAHPQPQIGKTPKFMMVFDSPHWQEEKTGKLLTGDNAAAVKAALKDAGLSAHDGYFTTLVKAGKPKGNKSLTNEQINGCSVHLETELEILKPPVIVTMGPASTKYFAPTLKGGNELLGKVIFDPKRDASIVLGFNPAQIYFDPSKITLLQNVCTKIADLVN